MERLPKGKVVLGLAPAALSLPLRGSPWSLVVPLRGGP